MEAAWAKHEGQGRLVTGCGAGSDNRTGIVCNGSLYLRQTDCRKAQVLAPAEENNNVIVMGSLGNVLGGGPLDGYASLQSFALDGGYNETKLVMGAQELQLLRLVPRFDGEILFSGNPVDEREALMRGASLLWKSPTSGMDQHREHKQDPLVSPLWNIYSTGVIQAFRELYQKTKDQIDERQASIVRIGMVLKLIKAINDTTTLSDTTYPWFLVGCSELKRLSVMQLSTAMASVMRMAQAAGGRGQSTCTRSLNSTSFQVLKDEANTAAKAWQRFCDLWVLPYAARSSIVQNIERGRDSAGHAQSSPTAAGVFLLTKDDTAMIGQLPSSGYWDEQHKLVSVAWEPSPSTKSAMIKTESPSQDGFVHRKWVEEASLHLKQLVEQLQRQAPRCALSVKMRRRLGGYVAFGYSNGTAGTAKALGAVVAGIEPTTKHGGITRYLQFGQDGRVISVERVLAQVACGEIAAFTECGKSAHSFANIGGITPNVLSGAELDQRSKQPTANDQIVEMIDKVREQDATVQMQCRIGGMVAEGIRSLQWGYGKNAMTFEIKESSLNQQFQGYVHTPKHDVYYLPFTTVLRAPGTSLPTAEHSHDPLVGIRANATVEGSPGRRLAALVAIEEHAETVQP